MMAAVVASALLATAGANAASDFDGSYVGVGATMGKGTWSESVLTTNEGSFEVGANLNAGYGTTFGSFYLGGDFAYNTNGGDLGKNTMVVSRVTINTQAKAKSSKFVSIVPGFVVAPSTMIYGRFGIGSGDFEVSAIGSNGRSAAVGTNGGLKTIGAGVRYNVIKNVSAIAEISQTTAFNTDGAEPRIQTITAGVQYRF